MNVSVVVRGPDFNAASGGETKYMILARNMPHIYLSQMKKKVQICYIECPRTIDNLIKLVHWPLIKQQNGVTPKINLSTRILAVNNGSHILLQGKFCFVS